jgi:hypothetical protein
VHVELVNWRCWAVVRSCQFAGSVQGLFCNVHMATCQAGLQRLVAAVALQSQLISGSCNMHWSQKGFMVSVWHVCHRHSQSARRQALSLICAHERYANSAFSWRRPSSELVGCRSRTPPQTEQ